MNNKSNNSGCKHPIPTPEQVEEYLIQCEWNASMACSMMDRHKSYIHFTFFNRHSKSYNEELHNKYLENRPHNTKGGNRITYTQKDFDRMEKILTECMYDIHEAGLKIRKSKYYFKNLYYRIRDSRDPMRVAFVEFMEANCPKIIEIKEYKRKTNK